MYYATKNGVEKRIESWKVIIPLFDNQQKQFPERVIEVIKLKIVGEFGGLTAFDVVGHWKSGRNMFSDENIRIIVDIPVKDREKASTFLQI